jgi:hypothetical protein
MLKDTLIILMLALTQVSCYTSEETGAYKPTELSLESRQGWEQWKREFLQLEDLKVGDGTIAAWGRKVSADIEVRYADGTLVYHGPAIAYVGMRGSVLIHNNVDESDILSLQQQGIILGLNGMAVGGKRRITIAPNLVCYEGAVGESTSKGADRSIVCRLVRRYLKNGGIIQVRKETLIIEATLTASCIPVFLDIPYVYRGKEFRCRNADGPQRDLAVPVWHIY